VASDIDINGQQRSDLTMRRSVARSTQISSPAV
jgi:hypothetical protein